MKVVSGEEYVIYSNKKHLEYCCENNIIDYAWVYVFADV